MRLFLLLQVFVTLGTSAQQLTVQDYFKKAKEAQQRSDLVRQAALTHEQLNQDSLRNEAGGEDMGKNHNFLLPL